MLAAFGCSRDARAVRLAHESGAEVYRISCAKDIQPCRAKADALCRGRYETLEASGVPIEPPRITSAPGPRSTGSRYQRADWAGTLVVACGTADHEAERAAPPPARADGALEPAGPELPPGMLCIPGATQLCLGAGACRGAQACLDDGRGYGPCDCGPDERAPEPTDAGLSRTRAAP